MSDAVEPRCEAGCCPYYGGERRHHKDCVFYEGSFTQMYHTLQAENALLREALQRQCDNMAFVLNRVELHQWHVRFALDLETARKALENK